MSWQQLNIRIESKEEVEMIGDYLESQGALAISIKDGGNEDLFQEAVNETPLWKINLLQALFPPSMDLLPLITDLQTHFHKTIDYNISLLPEQNWVEVTQQNFPPLNFANQLWIVPSWVDATNLSGKQVRLDPGLGFGTGAHPTTALCILELLKQSLKNKLVIDYGCGSGILGLVALALGAEQVFAVDHDPQALIATRNNAELNGFIPTQIVTVLPEELPTVKADIVLANILANPLCHLADQLIELLQPNGILILSGFLFVDLSRLLNIYKPRLQFIICSEKEDWQCLVLQAG